MTDTTTPTRSDVLRALADRVERTPNVEGEAARFQRLAFDLKCAFEDITLIHAGHLLTSLDATEALRQAVLPGWWIEVKVTPDVWDLRNTSAFAWASISSPGCWARGTDVQAGPAYRLSGQCDARLPNAECRVRLAALLRALAAQETGNAG